MRLHQLPLRIGLLTTGVGLAAIVYAAFQLYERPGLGIGHFYYLSILLVALATGPWVGALVGFGATALFANGLLLDPALPSWNVVSPSTGIRFVTFVAVGVVTGYFAKANREATAELELLADRDAATGLPNTRGFERAIGQRLASGEPFVLLVGALDAGPGTAPRSDDSSWLAHAVADRLVHALEPEAEVARISHGEFAVLAGARGGDAARRLASRLQRTLVDDGLRASFGWATFPRDGDNALSLYRVADERLWARRVISRNERVTVAPLERRRTPASGLGA